MYISSNSWSFSACAIATDTLLHVVPFPYQKKKIVYETLRSGCMHAKSLYSRLWIYGKC